MPRFDGTGPEGLGPYGRRLGPCGTGEERGFLFWRGRRGGGRGYRWFPNRFAFDEKTDLEAEKAYLQNRLNVLNRMTNQDTEE